jgi:hypothetical protein
MNAVFYISGKSHLLAVLDAEQNKLVTFDAHNGGPGESVASDPHVATSRCRVAASHELEQKTG